MVDCTLFVLIEQQNERKQEKSGGERGIRLLCQQVLYLQRLVLSNQILRYSHESYESHGDTAFGIYGIYPVASLFKDKQCSVICTASSESRAPPA